MTGHRADMLPEDSMPTTCASASRDVLRLIERAGARLVRDGARLLCGSRRQLRFVSPVADGADQIAAEVALELGWELQAILPFERAAYRASLANHGARERFDALIERAELPARTARRP